MERDVEKVATVVVDAAFHIYKDLGPGLLESVYEVVLEQSLAKRGLYVERQKAVSFEYEGIHFENKLFLDMLVNKLLVVELKSVEKFATIHSKQLLTYLRLSQKSLGLLINFNALTFKEGCRRIANNHIPISSSPLTINQKPDLL